VGRPALKREVVEYIIEHYGLNWRGMPSDQAGAQYLTSKKDPKLALQ